MDETKQEATEEQANKDTTPEETTSEETSSEGTSPDLTQSDIKELNKVVAKIQTIFQRFRTPAVFNTFNVVILLVILLLLILQPHWKKDTPMALAPDISEDQLYPPPTEEELEMDAASTSEEDLQEDAAEPGEEESEEPPEEEYTGPADVERANILFERRRYEQALEEFTRVSEEAPTSVEEDFLQYHLGKCYQEVGRFDDAISSYRKVITEYFDSPYLVRSILGEGGSLIGNGNYLKGRKHLFALVAQEAMYSDEDQAFVSEAYYKIAESYMKEAVRYARIHGYAFEDDK